MILRMTGVMWPCAVCRTWRALIMGLGRQLWRGQCGWSSMSEAAWSGLDQRDRYGRSALHYAVKAQNVLVVRALLYHGANPNAYDTRRIHPIHVACCNGNESITRLLLAARADASVSHASGLDVAREERSLLLHKTPAHFAAERGHVEVLRILLAHGASVCEVPSSAIASLCSDEGAAAAVRRLLSRGRRRDKPQQVSSQQVQESQSLALLVAENTDPERPTRSRRLTVRLIGHLVQMGVRRMRQRRPLA